MPKYDVEIIFLMADDRPAPYFERGLRAATPTEALADGIALVNKRHGHNYPDGPAAFGVWPAGSMSGYMPLTKSYRLE